MAHFRRGPDEDPDDFADRMAEQMAKMFPPGQFDQQLRQALQFLWFSLPRGQRNMDGLEAEARRIFDRTINNFRDDGGQPTGGEG